jgi:carbonic anhydrase
MINKVKKKLRKNWFHKKDNESQNAGKYLAKNPFKNSCYFRCKHISKVEQYQIKSKFMKFFLVMFLAIFSVSCSRNWSYEGRTSPQYWGDLKPEFKFCKIGYNQSPINIESEFENNDLKFSYAKSDVEKQPKNHVIQIVFDDKDFVLRGKKKYFVRQLYFHHPSEHLIADNQYSLELQIFHKSADEQLLALAIFLEVGQENPQFAELIQLLTNKKKEGKLDLGKIVKSNDKTFFYDGSITTPPCTEGVKWYIMKTPIYISKNQMNQIIKKGILVKHNSRPTQKFHPEKY